MISRAFERHERSHESLGDDALGNARSAPGGSAIASDVEIIAGVSGPAWWANQADCDPPVAVVSDDRRVRTVAEGLGATVTGTSGVVVRTAVEYELAAKEAKTLVRRIDSGGPHPTGGLREEADGLIEAAAADADP